MNESNPGQKEQEDKKCGQEKEPVKEEGVAFMASCPRCGSVVKGKLNTNTMVAEGTCSSCGFSGRMRF